MYGSGAYGQSAYASTVSSVFISTSVSPGRYDYSSILTLSDGIEWVESSSYNYSSILTISSGIELVESANYDYSGIQVLGAVESSVYNYIAIQCKDGVTDIVGDGDYVYVGAQETGNVYPFSDTIIIVHDYNSEIIEVS